MPRKASASSIDLVSNDTAATLFAAEVFPNFDAIMAASGIPKYYSTKEAASFFPGNSGVDGDSKSDQWMYWGMREKIFIYPDGRPIEPQRVGKRKRFTLPLIFEVAMSCHRRGILPEHELKEVLRRILLARYGESAFASSEDEEK